MTNTDPNTMPNHPSLLDQIHATMQLATDAGYPLAAKWMREHADEPCPAAIAQAMAIDAEVSGRKCVQTVNVFGLKLHRPCGEGRTDFDLLERDDALERAAWSVLDVLSRQALGTWPRADWDAFNNLRTTLAARRTRKAE